MTRKVTTATIGAMHEHGEKIAMVTAYDATFAYLLDEAGADILLVGDSLGMVVQGQRDTLSVTVDHMIYHCAAVSRGAKRALVVGDMPFLAAQITPEEALKNAGRLLSEGGAHAVKIEGGSEMAPTVQRLVQAGIPVMGHIGLTPQSVHQLGGFRAQGKDIESARALIRDALALQEAGCFSLVIECVPGPVAKHITAQLSIPTIGIGAGVGCDGQVLVCYDMLGMNEGFKPRFLKEFASLGTEIRQAISAYVAEVRAEAFPAPEHTLPGAAPSAPTAPAVTPTPLALYGGGQPH